MPHEHRKIYKVFIASPSDVEKERRITFEVINKLNKIYKNQSKHYRLEIRAWEEHSHPDLGSPQDVIKRQISIDKCDIFIGIFWRRFGTPPGSVRPSDGKPYLSGTQQEIEEAIAAREASENGRPVIMLYRKINASSGNIKDEDVRQYARVTEFFEECKPTGEHPALIAEFEGADFEGLLEQHLLQTVTGFENLRMREKAEGSRKRKFKVIGGTQDLHIREPAMQDNEGKDREQTRSKKTVRTDQTHVYRESIAPAGLRRHLQRLDSVEIRSLCLDHFPEIYDKFSSGLRRDVMINLLLERCRRNPAAARRLSQILNPDDRDEDNWFEKIGLLGNPFQYQIAEEDEGLANYRMQPQILKPLEPQLRGDDAKGRWIIFADKGHGKTALRQMIEQRHFPHNPQGEVLCITCDLEALERVSGYVDRSLGSVESHHYVRLIGELILENIESISEYDRDFQDFLSACDIQETSSSITAYQKLKALVGHTQQWRFKGILCLVDQVDEVLIVESNPENMIALIKPLMRLSLTAMPGIAFRYFLPSVLEPLLLEQHDIFRPGRYRMDHLTWTERDLRRLIAQRLGTFSVHQLDAYTSLGQLCDPKYNFRSSLDQELVQLAAGCPRAVIWLANRLIQLHCQSENPPRFIQRLTWEKVKAEWWAKGRRQLFGSLNQKEGFRLIGEQIYCQGKPLFLSEKSEALLRCLIRARGDLCSKRDLILVGWPDDDPKGVTDGALQEAMRRMKNELEEEGRDSRWIVTVRGRGYRLRKPTDTK
jgi:hypothetical protein